VEKALQLNDKDYMVWGNLAFAYEASKTRKKRTKRTTVKSPCWKRGSGNPRDAVAQSNLGLLYAKKKLREQAISRIQSALALSPDDTTVLEAVGQAYEDLGDRAEALQYIEKSVQKGYAFGSENDSRPASLAVGSKVWPVLSSLLSLSDLGGNVSNQLKKEPPMAAARHIPEQN